MSEEQTTIRTSAQIDKLAEALAAAQGEMGVAKRSSYNEVLKTHYADLASVHAVYAKPFSKHGLSLIQVPTSVKGGVRITTRVLHSSGQWIEGDLNAYFPDNASPQVVGLIVTYLRRITASPMAGVVVEGEDNDGEKPIQPTAASEAPGEARPTEGPAAPAEGPQTQPQAADKAQDKALEGSYKKALTAVKGAKNFQELNTFIAHIAKKAYNDAQKAALQEAVTKRAGELTAEPNGG